MRSTSLLSPATKHDTWTRVWRIVRQRRHDMRGARMPGMRPSDARRALMWRNAAPRTPRILLPFRSKQNTRNKLMRHALPSSSTERQPSPTHPRSRAVSAPETGSRDQAHHRPTTMHPCMPGYCHMLICKRRISYGMRTMSLLAEAKRSTTPLATESRGYGVHILMCCMASILAASHLLIELTSRSASSGVKSCPLKVTSP